MIVHAGAPYLCKNVSLHAYNEKHLNFNSFQNCIMYLWKSIFLKFNKVFFIHSLEINFVQRERKCSFLCWIQLDLSWSGIATVNSDIDKLLRTGRCYLYCTSRNGLVLTQVDITRSTGRIISITPRHLQDNN